MAESHIVSVPTVGKVNAATWATSPTDRARSVSRQHANFCGEALVGGM